MKRYNVVWMYMGREVGRRTCYDKSGADAFANQKRREGYKVHIE